MEVATSSHCNIIPYAERTGHWKIHALRMKEKVSSTCKLCNLAMAAEMALNSWSEKCLDWCQLRFKCLLIEYSIIRLEIRSNHLLLCACSYIYFHLFLLMCIKLFGMIIVICDRSLYYYIFSWNHKSEGKTNTDPITKSDVHFSYNRKIEWYNHGSCN